MRRFHGFGKDLPTDGAGIEFELELVSFAESKKVRAACVGFYVGTFVHPCVSLFGSQESLYPQLSLEQRTARCKQLREEGNACFGRGAYLQAKHCYLKALSFVEHLDAEQAASAAAAVVKSDSAPAAAAAAAPPALLLMIGAVVLKQPCFTNLAACAAKLGDHRAAVEYCTKVLPSDLLRVRACT
mgnify:CR=1 FL=1